MSDTATKILGESVGKAVLVRLKGGRSLRGILQGFDQHIRTDDFLRLSGGKIKE